MVAALSVLAFSGAAGVTGAFAAALGGAAMAGVDVGAAFCSPRGAPSSAFGITRRSRAPPGKVAFGSIAVSAASFCLPSLSTKGKGVFMMVIATQTAMVKPMINPMMSPATVPPA